MHLAQFFCLLLIGIQYVTPIRGRSEIDVDILARLEALERQVTTQHHQLDLQNALITTHRSLITDLQDEIASHKTTIQKLEVINVEQQAELQQQKTKIDEQQRRMLQLEVALHTGNGKTPGPDMTVVDAILAKPGLQDVDKKGASLIQTERSLDVPEDNDFNKDIADKHPNLKARLVLSGEGPVAFHAINSLGENAHVGINQKVLFNKVLLNMGNGFQSAHGIFTAPAAGVYIFSTSIMTWLNAHSEIHAALLKNGVTLARVFGHGDSGHADQGSVTVTTQLAVGDQVWVSLIDIPDDSYYGQYYTSFTCTLLWPV